MEDLDPQKLLLTSCYCPLTIPGGVNKEENVGKAKDRKVLV
jgi:hypothetical protein